MISQLLSLFGVHKAGMVLGVASQVIRTFEQEFALDHDAKQAALGSLIDVLKAHKEAPAPAQPVIAPVAPK